MSVIYYIQQTTTQNNNNNNNKQDKVRRVAPFLSSTIFSFLSCKKDDKWNMLVPKK